MKPPDFMLSANRANPCRDKSGVRAQSFAS
jgi:hypothetical protein